MRLGNSEKKPDITIYSTPFCIFCRMVKEYLEEHGFLYRELNVAEDPVARNTMQKKSGQTGVPVVDINGHIIIGFDREKLADLLEISLNDS